MRGPALFLRGRQLCERQAFSVAGFIIFSDEAGTYCSHGVSYQILNRAGAKGFVIQEAWNPPGIFTYEHDNWSPTSRSGDSMVMVSMFWGRRKEIANDWRASNDLVLEIRPPHYAEARNVEDSAVWLIVLRIAAPAFAFATFLAAVRAVRDSISCKKKVLLSPGLVVLMLEAPVMLLVALMLACGQNGPMVFPASVHRAFFNLLSGSSVFAALVLALFLREEGRFQDTRLPRRLVFSHYGFVVAFSAVVYCGTDVALFIYELIAFSTDGLASNYLNVIAGFQIGIIFPSQLAIGLYYFVTVSIALDLRVS